MSANRQRLKSAIRSIAKTDPELRSLLGASSNRGGQPGASGVGVSEAEELRLCCDGSTSSSGTPGTEERDPDAASQTGLDPDDPARLTSGDGTLSGVTDCATGEPICMDGSGHIPPDGWENPGDPPLDPTYEEGIYYLSYTFTESSADRSEELHQTCGPARARAVGFLEANDISTTTIPDCPDSWGRTVFGGGDNGGDIGAGISRIECATNYDPICDEDPPRLTAWPADSCVNIARVGDKLVGSKYDPENDGSYSAPRDSIKLCDGSSSILYQPLPGGGFRTIESSAGVAVSGAVGYTYSADGTLTGTITQAEWDATSP